MCRQRLDPDLVDLALNASSLIATLQALLKNRLALVGGAITILKNMSSSMGRIIPYIMEKKKCSKPPTRAKTGYMSPIVA